MNEPLHPFFWDGFFIVLAYGGGITLAVAGLLLIIHGGNKPGNGTKDGR